MLIGAETSSMFGVDSKNLRILDFNGRFGKLFLKAIIYLFGEI